MSPAHEFLFRPLAEPDLPQVRELVQSSFDARLAPYMVATQVGWTDYLRVQLDYPALAPGRYLGVAVRHGKVCAFGDYRTDGPVGFLSYICVDPGVRGRGLARSLFAWLVEAGGIVSELALDVFADNANARALYDRLGFVERSRSTWWRAAAESVRVQGGPPVACPDLSVSLAALDRFGFCVVSARIADATLTFGRLGRTVLRAPGLTTVPQQHVTRTLLSAFWEIEEVFMVELGLEPPTGVIGPTALTTSIRLVSQEPGQVVTAGTVET